MKEYQEPTAAIVEFSVKDIVVTSSPLGTGGDEETNPGSIFGVTLGSNGMPFE